MCICFCRSVDSTTVTEVKEPKRAFNAYSIINTSNAKIDITPSNNTTYDYALTEPEKYPENPAIKPRMQTDLQDKGNDRSYKIQNLQ